MRKAEYTFCPGNSAGNVCSDVQWPKSSWDLEIHQTDMVESGKSPILSWTSIFKKFLTFLHSRYTMNICTLVCVCAWTRACTNIHTTSNSFWVVFTFSRIIPVHPGSWLTVSSLPWTFFSNWRLVETRVLETHARPLLLPQEPFEAWPRGLLGCWNRSKFGKGGLQN